MSTEITSSGRDRTKPVHDRHDPSELLLDRHGLGAAGPSGFAANIHDSRTRSHQGVGVRQGRIQAGEAAAVAETVGGDVENAHEDRPIQRDRPSGGAPDLGRVCGEGEADLRGRLGQRLGDHPGTGKGAEAGAAAGENGPGIAGDDVQAQSTRVADQGLERDLVQPLQMDGEW